MASLHKSRCFNHEEREAVARCPACGHFFCRECITEHDDRLICASCLQSQTDSAPEKASAGPFKKLFKKSGTLLKAGLSFMMLWIFFYAIGQLLLLIPDNFHSGDLWRDV